MSEITKKEVEHVAHLARLHVTEEELEKFTHDLGSILNFVDKLNELDTGNVEPTSHVLKLTNVTRTDTVKPSLPVDEALQNTADSQLQQIKVPSVIQKD